MSKTGPSWDLVLRANVVPDLNVHNRRLVVLHKAGVETIGKGQLADRCVWKSDRAFRRATSRSQYEKARRYTKRARDVGFVEDSEQPAPNA